MKNINYALIAPLLCLMPAAQGWGTLGHMTVGYIAQNFVSNETALWAQQILNDEGSSYLAAVAPWADEFRSAPGGQFSEPFHFIDANDDPPHSCNLNFNRDCGSKGCLVSAINNYTERLQDASLSQLDHQQALRFLVHFIGDAAQPLHTEGMERGGNSIHCRYGHHTTNLHHVWDSSMAEQYVGGEKLEDAERWSEDLTKAIQPGGEYADTVDSWVARMSLADPVGAAISMAADTNRFVCSHVMAPGLDALEHDDLSQDYYKKSMPVVALQVAKGGYRLAKWLDLIYAASQGGTNGSSSYGFEDQKLIGDDEL